MSDLSQAAGTRENILVVTNNSNSQAMAVASNITVSGTGPSGGQHPNSLSTSKMSKVILNSLTPNPVVFTPVTTTSNIIPGISQSSSRSSLCTPRSSTSLLSSTEIDMMLDVHVHHGHHHLGHHLQGHHHHPLIPSHALPVIGTPGNFLADTRHSLHISTNASDAADNANNANSSHLMQSAATLPNFGSNRLFLDSATNTVKMRNKSTGLNPAGGQSQSSKMMHLINSDSGLFSMLPSASSSSSLMASSSYLAQAQPSPHHLQHSYSSSSVPSTTHTVIRNLNPYSTLGMPSSASSISSNSSSMLHQAHHLANSGANSISLLAPDYEDYGSTTKARGSAAANQAAVTSALINQYRQSTGGSNANKIYGTIGSSDTRNDYESLYRKYADLDNFHSEVVHKLSLVVAENHTQRKKFDEVLKANQLLQQQSQIANREIEQLKLHLEQVKKQRDDANKECNNAMLGKSKAIKERQRMYEDKNMALHEYSLIMSERDSVHREIERLQEDLNVIVQKNESLEKENKMTSEELESLKRELTSSLLDRDRALKMCNDLKHKYGELQHQSIYGTLGHHHSSGHGYYTETATVNSSNSSLLGPTHGSAQSPTQLDQNAGASGHHGGIHWSPLKSFTLKGNHLSNTSSTSSVQSNQFGHGKVGPESPGDTSLTVPDGSSPSGKQVSGLSTSASSADQVDLLRKQFDRLQIELQDAYQEIQLFKNRRDWAFSERDKIVQERESIRTLCDKLRRERDRKVSDLAEALRESDEIKRQKNEAIKELKELKEKFDSNKNGTDKDSPGKGTCNTAASPPTTSTSHDSAIDLDESTILNVTNGNYFGLPDCEILEVHLKKEAQSQADWGFKIKVDDALDIIITNLLKGASPQLRVHDQLVKVNNVLLSTLISNEPSKLYLAKVESLIRDSGSELHLQLRRRRLIRTVQNVCLPTPPKMDQIDHPDQSSFLSHFGFDAECALIVNRVDGSATTANQHNASPLSAGDRIIAINRTSLNNLFGSKLVPFMLQQPVGVQAQVVRFVPNQQLPAKSSASQQPGRLSVCVDSTQTHIKELLTPPPPPPPIYLHEPSLVDLNQRTAAVGSSKYLPYSIVPPGQVQLPIIMSPRTPKGHPGESSQQQLQSNQNIPAAVPTSNFFPIISINGGSTVPENEVKHPNVALPIVQHSPSARHPPPPSANQMVDSSSDEEDDVPTFVVDEDNDADADDDDDDSTTTATSDSDTATEDGDLTDEAAEVKTIAKLDKVLEKYQVMDDYYGSTVTNSSGSSLLVMPLVPNVQQQSQPQQPVLTPQPVDVPATYEPIIPLPQVAPPPPVQSVVLPNPANVPPSGATVVRRSSRISSKKTRSQRCTLAASQLAEAAHELTLALSASSHTGNISSGDTWPRYRPPHQLLTSVLPSFYKNHGHELQKIYSKQGHATVVPPPLQQQQRSQPGQQQQQQPAQQLQPILANYDEITYLTTIHHPRRKQRKSLGVFADIFPTGDLMATSSTHSESGVTSGKPNSSSVACSTADTLTTAQLAAQQPSTRRSPRAPETMTTQQLTNNAQQPDYGVMGIPFDPHQMAYHSINSHHHAHHHATQQHSSGTTPSSVPPHAVHQSHRLMQSTQQSSTSASACPPSPVPLVVLPHSASAPQQQQQQASVNLTSAPASARASGHYGAVHGGTAHHAQQQYPVPAASPHHSHLEPDGHKMATLSRTSTYNSIKSKPNASSSYYSGPSFVAPLPPVGPPPPQSATAQSNQQQQPDVATLADPYYSGTQTQPQAPPSSYSPIYSTYSSYRAPLKANSDSQQSVGKQQPLLTTPTQQQSQPEGMYIFRAMPNQNGTPVGGTSGSTSVDYSVVSAQSQDKNVLKYYKTRQASGSSQTGVPPSPATATPLLSPPYSDVSSAPAPPKQQQQSTRSHLLSEGHYGTTGSGGSTGLSANQHYPPYATSDIYGQARVGKPVIANTSDIYGTTGRSGQSSSASSAYYGNPGALLASVSSSSDFPLSSQLPPQLFSQTMKQPYVPTGLANGPNRHSMNLGLLNLGSNNNGNTAPTMHMPANRDSLLLGAPAGGPPHYEHHLAHANLEAYGLPGSSKTLPNKHTNNTLLAISANPRASYKDGSYAHQTPSSVYASSSAYDSSHVSSRTSITSSLASTSGITPVAHLLHGLHPSYLPENIYGTLMKSGSSSSQRATPPPPAPAYTSSTDEVGMVNFEENFCQALNLMGPSVAASAGSVASATNARLHRFRIPSNSSTVSASRASSKSAFPGLSLLDHKSASNQSGLPLSTSGIYGGSNHGSGIIGLPSTTCGDRSSLVSSTGGQPPTEVKWIKCTKDGSPGSPIPDPRKAKPDDYRLISIERSTHSGLGIQILKTIKSKGVFVKMVTDNSLASQAGIKVGDQIIDICGINMRTADYENAAKVLKQCGDRIQMLVQFQADKFNEIWNMMTESERCNSMDSVGLSGSSNAQGSGTGTGSGTDQRQSADSIVVNEDDLDADHLRRASRNALSTGTSSVSGDSTHRYSVISDQSGGSSSRAIRRGSSRRSANIVEHDQNGLVIYHSRHSTLTNDDISNTSATSTLTRRPKVASLPHECSLLSNSPTSTSNEDQSSHSVTTTSASSSQANMNLPYSATSFNTTKDASTTVLHGSSALYSSPNQYGQYDHHHSRQDSQSPPSSAATNQGASSGTPPSTNGTNADEQAEPQSDAETAEYRHIVIENPSSSLGISLVGGNAVGIFVHQIRDEQLVSYGLAPGDQIIEYNGTDLRTSTAEQAAIELAKPADVVKLVVFHNMKKYHEIQETTVGDSFYIKAAFDRPSIDGSLGFYKNQVLYIDNTMYQGVPGVWGAWTVNAIGEKEKFGVIPSKYKAEEELMTKRGGGYDNTNGNSSIGSSTRRSFFRRRKNGSGSGSGPFSTIAGAMHFRSSSRDSTTKEIACYSDLASLRGPPHLSGDGDDAENADTSPPEYPVPSTYLKVKKLNYELPRPVIIIGPLKETFIEKLEQDFPDVFQKCLAEVILRHHSEEASINQELFENFMESKKLFDARRRGSYVECTTLSSVKKICDNNLHPLLDINQNKAVSRLIANDFHPVVVFLKFKSTKQIKEINRCPTEKLSSKAAKEMYEHSLKIEAELKELINVTIAGNNLSYMCTQIKKHVDQEQQRALWV